MHVGQGNRSVSDCAIEFRQGNRSVSGYVIEFRTLTASSGWNTEALFDVFFNGLSEKLKDELIAQESPIIFDALVDLAICVDSRVKQCRKWRASRDPVRAPSEGITPQPALPALWALPPTAPPNPEPMQINRYHICDAEKQRRLSSYCCLYCGVSGHYVLVQ